MNHPLTRRAFLGSSSAAFGTVGVLGVLTTPARGETTASESSADHAGSAIPRDFPRQDIDSVASVVGASHARFERVKELVTSRPALAKAVWDWGFGDWESALGAASHTGRRDIAEFLISHGARPDIFTLAMFGQLDAVREMVNAVPGIQRIPGPHGITLLQHARNRLKHDLPDDDKSRVTAVAEYLESLGDADLTATDLELSEQEKQAYVGKYAFGTGEDDVLVVALERRGWLTFARGDGGVRRLNRVEPHAFAPAGAPEVRIRFEVDGDRAQRVTVHDPEPVVKAARV